MVSPKMFSGTKDSNGKLTGVAMGRDCLTGADGTKRTGIFALVDDEVVFELDPVNKKYKFKGEVFANKGTFTGTVNANDGVIGGFEIEGSGLKNISGRDAIISVQTDFGDHQRQAALGNTLSAMVGFDVSAYMSATGNWNSFNRALMLRASGSTMRKDVLLLWGIEKRCGGVRAPRPTRPLNGGSQSGMPPCRRRQASYLFLYICS